MKKLFEVVLTVTALCLAYGTSAQSFADNALTFSRTRPGGSARIQGLGGTSVSLGGDYTAGLSNPAGLGMYNRSEFTFSPGLNFANTSSTYRGNGGDGSRSVFNIPGISLVYNSMKDCSDCVFKGGSFSVGVTRTNDFNSAIQYSGRNNESIVDYFIDDAWGIHKDNLNYDFPTGLAYDNYLIQDYAYLAEFNGETPQDADYREYFSELDPLNGETRTLTQSETNKTKGSQYQVSIGYGANIKDKFFFGASFGLTSLRYRFSRTYQENEFSFTGGSGPAFNPLESLRVTEDIDIKGSGINLTLGAIVRPVDFMQLGISYATPTYYSNMTDTYVAGVSTRWNNYKYYDEPGTLNSIDYKSEAPTISEYSLTTPGKLSAGATFFLGKYGFVSGDVEWVNYSRPRYGSNINDPNVSFTSDNDAIKGMYTSVMNYRTGIELRHKIFRLRGGYGIQANPYREDLGIDKKITNISGGAGLRFAKMFVDFAIMQSSWNSIYSPYVFLDGTGPQVEVKNKLTSSVVTVGFNF